MILPLLTVIPPLKNYPKAPLEKPYGFPVKILQPLIVKRLLNNFLQYHIHYELASIIYYLFPLYFTYYHI